MKQYSVVKKRKLSSSLHSENSSLSPNSEGISSDEKTFLSQAAKWNLEQHYEIKPRKSRKKGIETTRLPIKTAEGFIQQNPTVTDVRKIESDEESPSVKCPELSSKSFSVEPKRRI